MFRDELRRWFDGAIPDLCHAVDSPVHVSDDETRIRSVLALMPLVPRPVWGSDELHAGEMWNSNSVISWMLSQAGLVDAAGRPPATDVRPVGMRVSSSRDVRMSAWSSRSADRCHHAGMEARTGQRNVGDPALGYGAPVPRIRSC